MLNIEEINKTILDLEQHDTTYAVCEKLSWLYIVRDHITGQQAKQSVPVSLSGDSEFIAAVNGMDSTKAWEIIDELMDALKLTNERVYNGVMRRLHASKGY